MDFLVYFPIFPIQLMLMTGHPHPPSYMLLTQTHFKIPLLNQNKPHLIFSVSLLPHPSLYHLSLPITEEMQRSTDTCSLSLSLSLSLYLSLCLSLSNHKYVFCALAFLLQLSLPLCFF